MEFLGLSTGDFDFFRKKDKMSKEEYEKRRNEVKLHFRSLCYEVQKIHHKKTDGVLEINKEFQNFNKRSTNIVAEYGEKTDCLRKSIEMNTENMLLKLTMESHSLENTNYIIDTLKNKKSFIRDYVIASKYNQIYSAFKGKNNRISTIKFNALEINTRNYDTFIGFIEKNISNGNFEFEVEILHIFPKGEAAKQGKNFSNIIYDGIISLDELYNKLA